jgi:hypothetical protein
MKAILAEEITLERQLHMDVDYTGVSCCKVACSMVQGMRTESKNRT